MSENHEAIARRTIEEVWNKGKLEAIGELFTTGYVNNDPLNTTKGMEAYTNFVKKYRVAFPDCRLDIDEMISSGDTVVVRWRYTATHKGPLEGVAPTGRRVTGTGITINHFSGDRIREAFINWDSLGLMQQLGVVTLPGKATGASA
jgi:steroid delta-isomerase-like uncharacterized protein